MHPRSLRSTPNGCTVEEDDMREKIVHSFFVSLEWRVFAFAITNIFFWITTGDFWKATGYALLLQAVLFLAYMLWYFLRQELHLPLVPHPKKRH